MVWARIDDEILDNPKIVSAGFYGFALHVAAITWCCRNLTDGRIPTAKVTALLPCDRLLFDTSNPMALTDGPRSMGGDEGVNPQHIAEHLVACGLWERVPGGYQIHDFLEYNPSRKQVLEERERSRQSQKKWRDNKRSNGVTKSVSSEETGPKFDAPKSGNSDGPVPDPLSLSIGSASLIPADLPLTDEARASADMLGVQDIDGEWVKYKSHHRAHETSVPNPYELWGKWCVDARNYQRKARERDRARGQSGGFRPEAAPIKPPRLSKAEREARAGWEREALGPSPVSLSEAMAAIDGKKPQGGAA